MPVKELQLRGKKISLQGSQTDPYFNSLAEQISDFRLFETCLNSTQGVMYDIGANIGVTTSAAHDRTVYAFEPSPKAGHWLRLNTASRMDVTVVPCAIGRENTDINFTEGEMLAGSHLDPAGALTVSVRRLDDWRREANAPAPTFVKIDVEGNEQGVLDGAVETLGSGALILCEVNPWALDAFGGQATSVFLEGVRKTFGSYMYVVDQELVTVGDLNGSLGLTYALVVTKRQQWTDIVFSLDAERMHNVRRGWKGSRMDL